MIYNQKLGRIGEIIAEKYLLKEGYKILEKNFRCKLGEIDIIAMDKDELVFIEVKTRTNKLFGNPAEAVNLEKQKHMIKTAKFYVCMNKLSNYFARYDVIEINFVERKGQSESY